MFRWRKKDPGPSEADREGLREAKEALRRAQHARLRAEVNKYSISKSAAYLKDETVKNHLAEALINAMNAGKEP